MYQDNISKMSIYLPNKKHRLKTDNHQIFSKTKIALDSICILEEENRHNIIRNTNQFVHQLDEDLSRLLTHKQLKLGKCLNVQIFPYHEQYFMIDANKVIFPVRLFIKNVRNESKLYVGYDKQFPGIARSLSNPSQLRNRSYNYKYVIKNDMMVEIDGKNCKKSIKTLYLTFTSHKEMVMFNLKFDYIGFEGYDQIMQQQQIKQKKKKGILRIKTQTVNTKRYDLPQISHNRSSSAVRMHQISAKNCISQKQQQIQKIQKRFHQAMHTRSISRDIIQMKIKKQKNFMQINSKYIKDMKRQRINSMKLLKTQQNSIKQKRILINAKNKQICRQKQLQLIEKASVFRKCIQNYQEIYRNDKISKAKLCQQFLKLIFISNFVKKSQILAHNKTQAISSDFVVKFYVHKFCNTIYKKHSKNVQLIPQFKIRNTVSIYHNLQLQAKLIKNQSQSKCSKVIFQAFLSIKVGLQINHIIDKSIKYRRATRFIQKYWIRRYKARLYMLSIFANNHTLRMLKHFPYLKKAYPSFKEGNFCQKLCREYLKDESIKYRYIFDAYRKRVHEIEQFIEQNYKIREYNRQKPQKKHKKYLDIAQKPYKAQQRVFRNLDILKSMIRGWFQLQIKRMNKKNIMI